MYEYRTQEMHELHIPDERTHTKLHTRERLSRELHERELDKDCTHELHTRAVDTQLSIEYFCTGAYRAGLKRGAVKLPCYSAVATPTHVEGNHVTQVYLSHICTCL